MAQTVLGPFYEYQQSQKRVKDAIALEAAASKPAEPATAPTTADAPPSSSSPELLEAAAPQAAAASGDRGEDAL